MSRLGVLRWRRDAAGCSKRLHCLACFRMGEGSMPNVCECVRGSCMCACTLRGLPFYVGVCLMMRSIAYWYYEQPHRFSQSRCFLSYPAKSNHKHVQIMSWADVQY